LAGGIGVGAGKFLGGAKKFWKKVFFQEFKTFCPDFTKSKPLEMRLHPLHPGTYTSGRWT